jgi:hypothetical protein
MSNIKANILEKLELKNEKSLSWLLDECINRKTALNKVPGEEDTFEFRYQKFLKGMDTILNGQGKNNAPHVAVKILITVMEEFKIDISEEEAFIIYNLRDLGKFKEKDKKLFGNLKGQWGSLKAYALEETEFNETLRELKNVGLLELRKGAISLPQNVVVRF